MACYFEELFGCEEEEAAPLEAVLADDIDTSVRFSGAEVSAALGILRVGKGRDRKGLLYT